MKLTYELLHEAGTSGVGYNCHQWIVLGVPRPVKKGWLTELIGTEISESRWNLVMELKHKPPFIRKQILKKWKHDLHDHP